MIHKPVVCFFVDEGWAYQNHELKLASKRVLTAGQEGIGFSVICGPYDKGVKRNVVWVHILMLRGLQLSVHDVHPRIAGCENVAIQISLTKGLSLELKELTPFGIHKAGATAYIVVSSMERRSNSRPTCPLCKTL